MTNQPWEWHLVPFNFEIPSNAASQPSSLYAGQQMCWCSDGKHSENDRTIFAIPNVTSVVWKMK